MLKRYAIVMGLLLNSSTDAQTIFNSLEDIWKYADVHNITIRTAKFESEKAGYSKRQAYSPLLPQVSANGSFTDNTQLPTTIIPLNALNPLIPADSFRTVQFGRQFVYSGGVTAQMSILNLQNWYNARIAKLNEEVSKDSLANTRKAVYQQIATQYYSYLLMREAAKLSNQSAGIADSVLKSASDKFKAGVANEANVDVARLNLERAQQNQITAKYQMLIAKNNLKSLLGFSVNDSLTFEGSLRNYTDIETNGAFQEDPALRLALYRTKLSLNQLRAANTAYAPTVSILYNYVDQRYGDSFDPLSKASGINAWFPAQYWALQASLPIFTGGSRWYQTRKNRIAYNESKEQYAYAQQQSAINDENIRLSYQKAHEILAKAENVMKLSFDNYRHVSYRYESGIVPLEERLNAFKDYIDYQNQYLNSLSDMLVQLYQVKIRQQTF